jgi:hypothetical protein
LTALFFSSLFFIFVGLTMMHVGTRKSEQVVVTTLSGMTIRGTRQVFTLRFALRDAEVLDGAASTGLGGRVVIPRRQIALVQVLPAQGGQQ